MKSSISHCLLNINQDVQKDPILMESMKLIFEWANDMGIKGKKVFGLHFVEPDLRKIPAEPYRIYCRIECSEQEREAWEEQQRYHIAQVRLANLDKK